MQAEPSTGSQTWDIWQNMARSQMKLMVVIALTTSVAFSLRASTLMRFEWLARFLEDEQLLMTDAPAV